LAILFKFLKAFPEQMHFLFFKAT